MDKTVTSRTTMTKHTHTGFSKLLLSLTPRLKVSYIL